MHRKYMWTFHPRYVIINTPKNLSFKMISSPLCAVTVSDDIECDEKWYNLQEAQRTSTTAPTPFE